MPTLANIQGGSLSPDPTAISRGIQTGAQLGSLFRQNRLQDEALEQEQLDRETVSGAVGGALGGNNESLIKIAQIDPQLANTLFSIGQSQNKAAAAKVAEMNLKEGAFAASLMNMEPAVQRQQLLVRANEYQQEGNEAMAQELLGMANMDPQARTAELQQDIALSGLTKDALAVFGLGGGESSLPAEARTFNDLIKDFSKPQKKTAKLVKAGLKGRAMSNAELSAIESGDIKDYADWKAKMKQQQKFAEMTGTSRAKAIDKGFDTIVKIDAGIRNIDRAISALDKGAGVGAVEKLWPSIKAASVELDNIRGQMALDVVGATTFGALSKGELDLAKDIALPTGLNTDELKQYLADKKAAQDKLKAYYNEQIQFLDQGGTVAGFLRKKEAEQDSGSPSGDGNTVDWSDL